MFSHVFIGTADFERTLAFYEPLRSLLGIAQRFCDRGRPLAGWQMPGQARPLFLVGAPLEGEHAAGNGQMCVVCHEGV
jgi:lactoylglutathione lyase